MKHFGQYSAEIYAAGLQAIVPKAPDRYRGAREEGRRGSWPRIVSSCTLRDCSVSLAIQLQIVARKVGRQVMVRAMLIA